MSRKQGQSAPVSLSQNFLTSRSTIERLLKLTNIDQRDTVLEIGAGKGHITQALLGRCGQVIASEIDARLYGLLRDKFSGAKNLRLSNEDFLQSKLPQTEYKVFSNIPFAITTDIIAKLTQGKKPPLDAWLVVEKGAAKRFCGKPRDTLSSLLLRPFSTCASCIIFSAGTFIPRPGWTWCCCA